MANLTLEALSFLPSSCSTNNLARIFSDHLPEIIQADNYVANVIKNFLKAHEAGSPPITCGILFDEEKVSANESIVDPRLVVIAISNALNVISSGRGIDPGFSVGNEKASDISYGNSMTLHLTSSAVYPAFNWNDIELKTSDLQIVRNWIIEGRSKIKAKARPGLVTV